MNPDLIILFTGEILIILALYRFLLRDWVIAKWEEKIEEEGWLLVKLDPVIEEIEDRVHDKLQQFQDSFFGSVGAMTKKAKNMDPMNNIRNGSQWEANSRRKSRAEHVQKCAGGAEQRRQGLSKDDHRICRDV